MPFCIVMLKVFPQITENIFYQMEHAKVNLLSLMVSFIVLRKTCHFYFPIIEESSFFSRLQIKRYISFEKVCVIHRTKWVLQKPSFLMQELFQSLFSTSNYLSSFPFIRSSNQALSMYTILILICPLYCYTHLHFNVCA